MTEDIFKINPEVKLIGNLRTENLDPEEMVAFAARSTMKKDDLINLYLGSKKRGEIETIKNKILEATLGSGHIDVLDQAVFTLVYRDIPRLTTLYLVSLPYLSHLQQSMRYVEPYGIYLPPELNKEKDVKTLMEKSIRLYYAMVKDGIPKEDARFILPLYTATNIVTVGNARELTHLLLMSQNNDVPPITKKLVEDTINEISRIAKGLFKNRGPNYNRIRYYPAPQLFTESNHFSKSILTRDTKSSVRLISYTEPIKIEEQDLREAIKSGDESYLSILKHISFTFLIKMSLVTFHQAVRQRTWNHTVEPIYEAILREEYIVPPTIKFSKWRRNFIELVEELQNTYFSLIEKGYPKATSIGIISHSHTIYDMVKIDGWNYIGALPLRRCLRSQWEIRKISSEISKYVSRINPSLGKYSQPACRVFGTCPEKRPCEHIDLLLKKKPLINH